MLIAKPAGLIDMVVKIIPALDIYNNGDPAESARALQDKGVTIYHTLYDQNNMQHSVHHRLEYKMYALPLTKMSTAG